MAEEDKDQVDSQIIRTFNDILLINGVNIKENPDIKNLALKEADMYLSSLQNRDQLLNITPQKVSSSLEVIENSIVIDSEDGAKQFIDLLSTFYDIAFSEAMKAVDEFDVNNEEKDKYMLSMYNINEAKKLFTKTIIENGLMVILDPNAIPIINMLYPNLNNQKILLLNTYQKNFPVANSSEYKAAIREEIVHLMDNIDTRHPLLAKGWMKETLAKEYITRGVDGIESWDIGEEEKERVKEFIGYSRHHNIFLLIADDSQLNKEQIYSIYFGDNSNSEQVEALSDALNRWDRFAGVLSYSGEEGLNNL